MLRRLYSSACSSARQSRSAEASTSSSSGSSRGRVKPSWTLGARVSSKARSDKAGKSKARDVGLEERETGPRGELFQPIRLYPEQLSLHLAFTPPHLPLPINMGTLRYKSTGKRLEASTEPFGKAAPPSPVASLSQPSSTSSTSSSMSSSSLPPSAMTDHLTVVSSLAHPSLTHHLGPFSPFSSDSSLRSMGVIEPELHLTRVLAHASVSSRLSAEKSWDSVLDHLSGAVATQAKVEANSAGVEAAVDSLTALLGQIAVKAKGEKRRARWAARVMAKSKGTVQMDSVKRKRQKKISKHKYKKRRKATRSERRKLGK